MTAREYAHETGPANGEQMIRFLKDDAGQGLVEYALIITLVSVVAVAALSVLGKKASNSLSNSATALS